MSEPHSTRRMRSVELERDADARKDVGAEEGRQEAIAWERREQSKVNCKRIIKIKTGNNP